MPIVFLQGSLPGGNPEMHKKKKYGHGKHLEEIRTMERISEKPQLFSVSYSRAWHFISWQCFLSVTGPSWTLLDSWTGHKQEMASAPNFTQVIWSFCISEDSPWLRPPAKSSYSKESCCDVYRVPSALTPSKCLPFSLYVIRSLLGNTTKFPIPSLTLMLAITLVG